MNESLEQQKAYYRARASEYDEWFLRGGRYDRGAEQNAQWFAEVAQVQSALQAFAPAGSVLELACGTGWWTEQLARYAEDLAAVDASPEVLALNRERLGTHSVRYVEADLFTWQPEQQYDVVFFSFWLSHVPPERFAAFWETVRAALRPGGRFFVVDSLRHEASGAHGHKLPEGGSIVQQRALNDGRSFDVIKLFYTPDELAAKLAALGWQTSLTATESFFLYGSGVPQPDNK